MPSYSGSKSGAPVPLPATIVFWIVVGPEARMPWACGGPAPYCEFFVIVQLFRVSVPLLAMPPPSHGQTLPVTVQLIIVSVPLFMTPPPSLFVSQFETVMLVAVTVAFGWTWNPPPSPPNTNPFVMWMSLRAAVIGAPVPGVGKVVGLKSNARSFPFTSMVVPPALPLMVTLSHTSRSASRPASSCVPAIEKVIVPAGRLIVSAPDPAAQSVHAPLLKFAFSTASRIVQTPSALLRASVKPVTVIVAEYAESG